MYDTCYALLQHMCCQVRLTVHTAALSLVLAALACHCAHHRYRDNRLLSVLSGGQERQDHESVQESRATGISWAAVLCIKFDL